MALASTIAGGLIVLINRVHIFNLLTVTAFTIPILAIWYWVTNRMYHGYRETLQSSLIKNKSAIDKEVVREYTMDSVLGKEIKSGAEEKVSLHCRTEAAEGGQLSAQLAVTAAIGRLQAAQQILGRTADSLL